MYALLQQQPHRVLGCLITSRFSPPTHTVHARGLCGKLSRKHTSISRRCQPNEFYWDTNLSHQIHYAAALLRTAIDRTRACAPEQ